MACTGGDGVDTGGITERGGRPVEGVRVIESMCALRTAMAQDGAGHGSRISLCAELGEVPKGPGRRPVKVRVPVNNQWDPQGFTTLSVWRSWSSPVRAEPGQQVWLQGELRVSYEAVLELGECIIKATHRRGWYSSWRAAQAQRLGVSPDPGDNTGASIVDEELLGYLSQHPTGKIVWLGRHTQAFDDATSNTQGRPDHDVQHCLERADLSMGLKEHTKQRLTTYLRGVGDDVALVIIARGGGDPGQLMLFDDAEFLEAVRDCRAKTLAAVGHTRDTHLINAVADWSLPVPKSVYGVLYAYVHGTQTLKEQKREARQLRYQNRAAAANNAAQGAELAAQKAKVASLTRERDGYAQQVHALQRQVQGAPAALRQAWDQGWHQGHYGVVMVAADAARRRIATRLRVSTVLLGLVCVWFYRASDHWRWITWKHHHVLLHDATELLSAVLLVMLLLPKRLGATPVFRRPRHRDPVVAYQSARTIRQFNNAVQDYTGTPPRWRSANQR